MKYKQTRKKSLKLKPVCLKLKLFILLNSTKIVFAIHRKNIQQAVFPNWMLMLYFFNYISKNVSLTHCLRNNWKQQVPIFSGDAVVHIMRGIMFRMYILEYLNTCVPKCTFSCLINTSKEYNIQFLSCKKEYTSQE